MPHLELTAMHEQECGDTPVLRFEGGRHVTDIGVCPVCKIPGGRERIRGYERDAGD
jgi:hypothetical protein